MKQRKRSVDQQKPRERKVSKAKVKKAADKKQKPATDKKLAVKKSEIERKIITKSTDGERQLEMEDQTPPVVGSYDAVAGALAEKLVKESIAEQGNIIAIKSIQQLKYIILSLSLLQVKWKQE